MALRVDLISAVLETQLRKSESAVNALAFDVAKKVAERHLQAVDDLVSLWSMVHGTVVNEGGASNIRLRAQMNLIRCEALSSVAGCGRLNSLASHLQELFAIAGTQEERNRLLSYQALCLLKAQNWDAVIRWMRSSAESNPTEFTLLWRGRALNDCILAGVEVPAELITGVRSDISRAVDDAIHKKKHDHPFDLLLRELALIEAREGSVKKAKADLRLADTWLVSAVLESPIRNWLCGLNRAHGKYLSQEPLGPILESELIKPVAANLRKLEPDDDNNRILLELRLASPY